MNSKSALEWLSGVGAKFDEFYDKTESFKERYKIWVDLIKKYSNPTYRALDVGCGTGVFTFPLAELNKEVYGVDGSTEMIDICQTKLDSVAMSNLSFGLYDLNDMNAQQLGGAQLIISSSVLEYVDDFHGVLAQLISLLTEKGILLLSMPNRSSLLRRLEPLSYKIFKRPAYTPYVKHKLTPSQLTEILSESGLSVLESYYYSSSRFSKIMRPIGLKKYSEGLFVVAAQKKSI